MSSDSSEAICAFVAATDVEKKFPEWQCNEDGIPTTNPCEEDELWHGIRNCVNEEIESLDLYKQFIKGTLPDELGLLTSLKSFHISFNHGMHGTIPASLGKLTRLEQLLLHNSRYEGSVPAELCELPKLQRLFTSSNPHLQCYADCLHTTVMDHQQHDIHNCSMCTSSFLFVLLIVICTFLHSCML